MGLNWAQGAQNAAAGLDRLSQNKMAQSEMLYKDMAEKNRMRFEEKQSQDQRDFLSEQADIKWGREMPIEYGKLGLQGLQIEGQAEANRISELTRQESVRQTGMYQSVMMGQGQERLDQSAERSAAKTMQDQEELDRKRMKDIEDRHKSSTTMFDPNWKKAQAEYDYEFNRDMLNIKGKTPQETVESRDVYQTVYGYLTSESNIPTDVEEFTRVKDSWDKTHKHVRGLASDFAKMPPEVRQKISTEFDALGGKQTPRALGELISKHTGSPLGSWADPATTNPDAESKEPVAAAEAPAAKDRMATEAPAPKPVANSQRGRDAKLMDGAEKRMEESRDTTARSLDKDSREKEILELARDMARKNKVNFSGKNKEQFIVAAEKIYENRYAL